MWVPSSGPGSSVGGLEDGATWAMVGIEESDFGYRKSEMILKATSRDRRYNGF